MRTAQSKVIFCDVGNVLLFFDLFKAFNRFLKLGSHPQSQVLPKIFQGSFIADLETGKIPPDRLYKAVLKMFGMRLGYEKFCAIWTDIFTENKPMTRWLKDRSARHRVYLVSNTHALHYGYARDRYDFFRYVTGQILSFQVALRKPDPRIFFRALQVAGISPAQAFYIDDIPVHVEAAKRCGMFAHQYICPEATFRAWDQFKEMDGSRHKI